MAVFNKEADAGCIREDDLPKMKDLIGLSQIRIIAYSDAIPNWPLFSTRALSKTTAQKVQDALIKLKPGVERPSVTGAAMIAGFAPVSDKDFDTLRQAAKLIDDLGL